MPQPTDPLASGGSTAEGQLAIGAAIAGVLVAVLGAIQPVFQQASETNPNAFWLRAIAVLGGLALAGTSSWGLLKSRTSVKNSILDLLQAGAVTVAPLVAGAVLKKYLTSGTPQSAAVKISSDGEVVLKPILDARAAASTSATPAAPPTAHP